MADDLLVNITVFQLSMINSAESFNHKTKYLILNFPTKGLIQVSDNELPHCTPKMAFILTVCMWGKCTSLHRKVTIKDWPRRGGTILDSDILCYAA